MIEVKDEPVSDDPTHTQRQFVDLLVPDGISLKIPSVQVVSSFVIAFIVDIVCLHIFAANIRKTLQHCHVFPYRERRCHQAMSRRLSRKGIRNAWRGEGD